MNAILLAGGKSSRFGSNKALARFKGERLIEIITGKLKENFNRVYVIVDDKKKYSFLEGVKLLEDIIPEKGPLGGIYTGLSFSDEEYNFVMACDMPLISSGYLQFLKGERRDYEVLLSKREGRLEPLAGIYSKGILEVVKESLEVNNLRLVDLILSVKLKVIEESRVREIGDPQRIFYNVNYRDDLMELMD